VEDAKYLPKLDPLDWLAEGLGYSPNKASLEGSVQRISEKDPEDENERQERPIVLTSDPLCDPFTIAFLGTASEISY
jgi:hypothetical protein